MSKNRIAFTMKRTKTGEVADFDKMEVERFKKVLKDGLAHSVIHGALVSASPESANGDAQTALAIRQPGVEQLRAAFMQGVDAALRAPVVAIENKPLLTLIEASRLTGLSARHLRDAVRSGKLKGKIIGRAYRIKRFDMDTYIKQL
jgi:excisionase family DNA binding protein